MTEFELIARHFARGPATGTPPLLGIGDDCALLHPPAEGQTLAVSTDLLIEGRHFFAGTDPAAIGHKALAVNLSDLAAMGAEPLGFTLAIALPAIDEGWIEALCRGLFALAQRAGCPLIGGDTTSGPLCLSLTVLGQVPAGVALRRSGARLGDDLWVSGALGAAALAVAERQAGRTPPEAAARRLDWPEPRLALGRALRGLATAAIDLSDGLAGDLPHLLTASSAHHGSQLGADIEEAALPVDAALAALEPAQALCHALRGGDDYELLFSAPVAVRPKIEALSRAWPREAGAVTERSPFETCPLHRIGRLVARPGMHLVAAGRADVRLEAGAFDHFSPPPP